MSQQQTISLQPSLSSDERIIVIRRMLSLPGELEQMPVHAYILIMEHYVLLCDTLIGPQDMAQVREILRPFLSHRQLLVINSHADWDHCWGNCAFPLTVPIIAHKKCRIRLTSPEEKDRLHNYQQRYPFFADVSLRPPTMTIDQTWSLYDNDLSLHLFAAPGHCSDHCAAWIPELALLLAFDAVEAPIPCIDSATAIPEMRATLEHFLALQPRHLLASHVLTCSPTLVQENIAYLDRLEQLCRLALAHSGGSISPEQLANASSLIAYPFEQIPLPSNETIDVSFYSHAHEQNIQHMLHWLQKR